MLCQFRFLQSVNYKTQLYFWPSYFITVTKIVSYFKIELFGPSNITFVAILSSSHNFYPSNGNFWH